TGNGAIGSNAPGSVFANTGTVEVDSGTLSVGAGVSTNGIFRLSGSGILQLSNSSISGLTISFPAAPLPASGIYDAGGVTIAGPLSLSLGYSPDINSSITLIHSTSPVNGTFDGLP